MDRQTVYDYIKKKYKTAPEYPWRKYPGYAVFRHKDNNMMFLNRTMESVPFADRAVFRIP